MAKDKDKDDGDEAKGSPLKLILMIAPTALLVLAVVYFLFLKPSAAPAAAAADPHAATASASPTYKEGAVLTIEPITINLANGHFLKLGMALQETADAGEELNGAHALDRAIALYSGKTVDELSTKEGREKTKEKLIEQVMEDYEKKVYEIYFTTFVMQ